MNAFLKYCLLLTATFILLLHSFVPHQHHTISADKATVSACVHQETSLLGFLSKAFHLDLGSDHLDNFKPVQKVDFAFGVPMLVTVLNFEFDASELIHDTGHDLPALILVTNQYFTSQTHLRGPPRSNFHNT